MSEGSWEMRDDEAWSTRSPSPRPPRRGGCGGGENSHHAPYLVAGCGRKMPKLDCASGRDPVRARNCETSSGILQARDAQG
jgi:hypothetical protein